MTPQKYDQKPIIVSSGTKYSKSHRRAMFIATIKSPSVITINGVEISLTIGLIKKLISPSSSPAMNNVSISPSKIIPGTK